MTNDELAAVQARLDAVEAALLAWCTRLHEEWVGWQGSALGVDLCNEISNLKAAGLWREPAGGAP